MINLKKTSVPTVPTVPTVFDNQIGKIEPNQSVDNKPDKKQETKSPFSFDSLYSSITGLGKVEDLDNSKPDSKETRFLNLRKR